MKISGNNEGCEGKRNAFMVFYKEESALELIFNFGKFGMLQHQDHCFKHLMTKQQTSMVQKRLF